MRPPCSTDCATNEGCANRGACVGFGSTGSERFLLALENWDLCFLLRIESMSVHDNASLRPRLLPSAQRGIFNFCASVCLAFTCASTRVCGLNWLSILSSSIGVAIDIGTISSANCSLTEKRLTNQAHAFSGFYLTAAQ